MMTTWRLEGRNSELYPPLHSASFPEKRLYVHSCQDDPQVHFNWGKIFDFELIRNYIWNKVFLKQLWFQVWIWWAHSMMRMFLSIIPLSLLPEPVTVLLDSWTAGVVTPWASWVKAAWTPRGVTVLPPRPPATAHTPAPRRRATPSPPQPGHGWWTRPGTPSSPPALPVLRPDHTSQQRQVWEGQPWGGREYRKNVQFRYIVFSVVVILN